MNKIMDSDEAVRIIKDGATVVVCGCENLLLPEKILEALEKRFLETGHPNNLTGVHPIVYGMGGNSGLEHFAHKYMIKRMIGSGYSYLKTSKLSQMIINNELEAYVLPMGTVFGMLRDIAANRDFHITSVGINTFVDPRLEGGKFNEKTKEDIVSIITIEENIFLCYPTFPVDVAIIRGTTADTNGNISLEDEPVKEGIYTLAIAAKNSGGKVMAQVRRITQPGTIHPKNVVVPGIFVDTIVIDPEQSFSGGKKLNPSLTGEIRSPLETIEPLPLNDRKIILRRAFREIGDLKIINLGVGIPGDIPRILLEERGSMEDVRFFIEHGSIGGVPAERGFFGTSVNPEATIDSTQVFDSYLGGGLDLSFLGFAQIDQLGNVNVSKFNNIIPGCGGFIDITHKTHKVVFCGTLTAGGLKTEVKNGKLKIIQEGRFKKMIRRVEQVTFSGKNAALRNQEVIYITERAVFKLESELLTLTEIAPGIRLEEDVLSNIEFPVRVSKNMKIMDGKLFN